MGQQFWARGYWVSTVGRDEVAVRRYIQEQEKKDQRLDQLTLIPLWAIYAISSLRLCPYAST